MLKCPRCAGRVLVDRQYSSVAHLETYCIKCGKRKFYHPPTDSSEGTWLLKKEIQRAKDTISPL